jgi:hypothetical protein
MPGALPAWLRSAPRVGHRAASASVLARSHRLEARVTSSPSRRHPWNTCRIFLSSTTPYPPQVPRGPSRVFPAERAHRGLSPYWGVMAGASLHREDREPAGYKSRPLSHAQADVVVLHRRPTASSYLPTLPPPTKRPNDFTHPHTTYSCHWLHCPCHSLRRRGAPPAAEPPRRRACSPTTSPPRLWPQTEPW